MDIEPDAAAAAHDQDRVRRLTHSALSRAELLRPTDSTETPPDDELAHPAVVEVAHAAQRALRQGPLPTGRRAELADGLDLALEQARATPADTRSTASWPVELAGPQPHLARAVTRALAGKPAAAAAPDRPARPTTCAVATWTDAEREIFDRAATLLAAVWPGMLDELTRTTRQIVLLRGEAIDGFTDFTVHGAVFLNRHRLTPETGPAGSPGIPGELRLAEALVHEGTHQRCNAALVSTPFWSRDADRAGPVVTPLRADPRPLGGLFHQMVVLARGATFHRRLLDRLPDHLPGLLPGILPGRPIDREALRSGHARRLDDVRRAAATLDEHRSRLTEAGRRLLAQGITIAGAPG